MSVSKPIALNSPVKRKRSLPGFDITLCVFCKSAKRGMSTSGSEAGRCSVLLASQKLNEDIISSLAEDEKEKFVYHRNCYSKYVLRAERQKDNSIHEDTESQPQEFGSANEDTESNLKKRILRSNDRTESLVCIICNAVKTKGDKKTYAHM